MQPTGGGTGNGSTIGQTLAAKVVSVTKLLKYAKGDALCSMQVAEAGGNSVRVWVHVEGDSR